MIRYIRKLVAKYIFLITQNAICTLVFMHKIRKITPNTCPGIVLCEIQTLRNKIQLMIFESSSVYYLDIYLMLEEEIVIMFLQTFMSGIIFLKDNFCIPYYYDT